MCTSEFSGCGDDILRLINSAAFNIAGHEITVPPQISDEAQTVINLLSGMH